MDRRYLRSSSLARKFFDDFPEANDMPLEFMNAMQHRAYDQHVLPLLELFNSHPSLNYCCGAVKHLVDAIVRDKGIYEQSRAAAEYIQSPFAVCALDAAAACSVHPLAAQFYRQLFACDTTALDELLYEDIRRRLVANGLQDLTESLSVQLDNHPAVSAATPHPTELDRLVLPRDAAYNSNCSNIIGLDSAAPGSESRSAPAASGTCSSQQASAPASADSTSADATATASAVAAPSILKRAAWRRQLSRLSSHYLAPILGKDGPGSVLLTGRIIADVVEGVNTQPTPETAAAEGTRDAPSNEGRSVLDISFVGYGDAAAAQSALDGCLKELITRWFMRHPAPLTNPQGQTLLPLAVAARQHLLLLLPEPTQPQLPAAVHIDAAAMQAAVDHGAFEGPAAAAATTGQQITHLEGIRFRDVIFRFDLALHPNIGVLLLSAAAAGDLVTAPAGTGSGSQSSVSQMHRAPVLLLAAANARNAFAYDGDYVYTLPSAVRALASGRTLVDLAAVAAACGSQDASGNACSAAAAAVATGRCSVTAAALMEDPAALRAMLDPGQRQQQQQQQVEGTQVEGQNAAAPAGANNGRMTDTEKHRIVQQLRRDHKWVWGLVDRPDDAATNSDGRQGTHVGGVPDIVHKAVASSWWKGPVMRGSVLYGADV